MHWWGSGLLLLHQSVRSRDVHWPAVTFWSADSSHYNTSFWSFVFLNAKPPLTASGPVPLVQVPPSPSPAAHPCLLLAVSPVCEHPVWEDLWQLCVLPALPPALSSSLPVSSWIARPYWDLVDDRGGSINKQWEYLSAEEERSLWDSLEQINLPWFSSTDSQLSSAPQSPAASVAQPSLAWHGENISATWSDCPLR